MPRYQYECSGCGAVFDLERPMSEAAEHAHCPVCNDPAERVITSPKLMFKADPRDNKPYWHHHDGYGHSHAPRRGRHRTPDEDH